MADKRVRNVSIVDRQLSKGKSEINVSSFAFLFSEYLQYCQRGVQSTRELEMRLEDAGVGIGVRVLELLGFRTKLTTRKAKIVPILQFVTQDVWRCLFGKPAEALEKSIEADDEYMISENQPLVNRFISLPRDLQSQFSCAAFTAGIVKGVLDAAGFESRVTAHTVPIEGQRIPRTTILIKFSEEVMIRETQKVA